MAGLLVVLSPVTPAWAGGIWFYEMATPDQGTAAAGRAALGLDASTAWLNPAGMTRLEQSQLLLGAGPIVIQSSFDVDPGRSLSGGGATLTTALPVGSDITLGADFTLIDAGSAPVNESGGPLMGTVVGSYSPNLIYAVGLNLIWRF